MTKFRWHADYFDSPDKTDTPVRKAIIQADNADDAEKIAKAEMGLYRRVEVRRAATAAPVRVIYAREEPGGKFLTGTQNLASASKMPTAPVVA